MKEVYIVDGIRTPIGKFGKSLKDYSAVDLAAFAMRKLFEKARVSPESVELVIMGHVIRAGTGMNTARQAAIRAGVPAAVDAFNVDMVCASGMSSIVTGAMYIKSGQYDVILAGGMESMSNAPFILHQKHRWGVRHFVLSRGKGEIYDAMVHDGLYDPLLGYVMGEEADITAKRYGAQKEELDWIGYESHRRAAKAWEGAMERYVAPFPSSPPLEKDEGIKWDITLEEARAQQPVFSKDGLHTVYTSSQLSDGASVVLLASKEGLKKLGVEGKAVISGHAYAATDPVEFPIAPVYAVRKLLSQLGWSVDKVDFWENNEAFAVNSYLMNRQLGVPYERLNVHGGAIALGHPLGASGARITIELLNVLETRGGRKGIASICHGLGGAAALALELP
ncbi:MAG: thiolase family protein [Acidilobaceae archaeon]|nr:thiolase family protein [Acidilobaceae archaeon]MCX8165091.1 thiolase family protein [Acidilobaceae archaeon]MDW7974392.1 thiolase family protein [Sulfolobales archaeon]